MAVGACAICGMTFAYPVAWFDATRKNGFSSLPKNETGRSIGSKNGVRIYCPRGHCGILSWLDEPDPKAIKLKAKQVRESNKLKRAQLLAVHEREQHEARVQSAAEKGGVA